MLPIVRSVMLVALALASCARADKPAKTGPPSDGIALVTASVGTPQRSLRYHLVKGARTALEFAITMEINAGCRDSRLPTLVMAVDIAVDDVLPDASAKIRYTISSATARERPGTVVPASAMNAMTPMLAGLSYTATLLPDGKLQDVNVHTPKSLPAAMTAQVDQLRQNLEQVAMRFPDEAIGVGAKWTTRKTVSQTGLEMVTVTTVEVTSIAGDTVGFTYASTVSAPDQTVVQDGVLAQVMDIGGGGSGKGTIDLAHMTMTGELAAEFRGTISAKGQTAPMKMALAMTMKPL
jgi:hypothetical protein